MRRTLAAIAVTLTVLAASCAGARNSLGTDANSCFRALPPAKNAVHGKGRLLGVRRVSTAELRQRIPNDTRLTALPDQDLCVFAFQGTYDSTQVIGASGQATGPYAVVAVTTKRPALVGSIVTSRLPTRFAHLH